MLELKTILVGLISSLGTAFAQWVFYYRKHRAEGSKSEIENIQLIAKEWREAAQIWKQTADEYHLKAIDNMKRIEGLEKEVGLLKRDRDSLNRKLAQANKEIQNLKSK